MTLTATRPPLVDAAPALQPVSALQDALRVQVGLQDAIALRGEVGVGAELHRLALEEDDGLEEGVAGSSDADPFDSADPHAVQPDLPLGKPAGVELNLNVRQARVHAGTVARAALKVRVARIQALHEQGLRPEQIGERLSMSQRQVQRWLNHLVGDDWKVLGRVTDEQRRRVIELAGDQVPPGWIAEDCGLSRRKVDMVRDEAEEELPIDGEWASIRRQIQARPELFELHLQFMPQKLRRS